MTSIGPVTALSIRIGALSIRIGALSIGPGAPWKADLYGKE
jgi:hypothetical protein